MARSPDAPHLQPDLPEDIEDLARRYVDLWQDQLAAMAADPEYWGAVRRLFDAFAAGAALPAAFAGGRVPAESAAKAPEEYEESGEPRATGRSSRRSRNATNPAETRSATASPASRGGGDDVADLARRLARLEERLAALEAAP